MNYNIEYHKRVDTLIRHLQLYIRFFLFFLSFRLCLAQVKYWVPVFISKGMN